jgi:adenine phosphoribosyltransferase
MNDDALRAQRIELVRARLRDVPDFPKPGILFKDITPVLADPVAFAASLDALADHYRPYRVAKVLGVEARGFIFGAALAVRMGVGFVPARKPGKLPAKTDRVTYALEYGTDTLEVHTGSFVADEHVLVVDDVIATGGTAAAAVELARRQGARVVGVGFVIELAFLGGRAKLPSDVDVFSVLTF